MPPQPQSLVLHRFDAPSFVRATLLRRYKRFLADVHLEQAPAPSGGGASLPPPVATTTVHCPNTGPMIGLIEHLPAPARLSVSQSATRKYAHTLEMIRRGGGGGGGGGDLPADGGTAATAAAPTNPPVWVGVRSALANALTAEMLAKGLLDDALGGPFERVEREVAYGGGGGGGGKKAGGGASPASRVDFVLHRPATTEGSAGPRTLHLEVKSVTLAEGDLPGLGPPRRPGAAAEGDDGGRKGVVGIFPDTVSERASRHMRELSAVARRAAKADNTGGDTAAAGPAAPATPPAAACLFVVQRGDVGAVAPAWRLDRAYGEAVREAAAAGVALVAARCRVEPEGGDDAEEERGAAAAATAAAGGGGGGAGGAIVFDGLVPVLVERGAAAAAEAEASERAAASGAAKGRKRAKK